MKRNRGKLILIVLCILISLYFLYPTYQDHKFEQSIAGLTHEDSLAFVQENETAIREARQKKIKLGLDLQGGMRVVLEVDVLKLLGDLAKNKDENFQTAMAEVTRKATASEQPVIEIFGAEFKQAGLRLSRYYGNIRDTDDDILSNLGEETDGAVDRAIEIVRNRVDQYGVSEPSIQKQGGRRIIVELPGVSNEEEVEKLLQGTALLEFKLLKEPEITLKVYDAIDKILAGKPVDDSLAAAGDTSAAARAAASTATAQARTDTAGDAADPMADLLDTALTPLPEDQLKAEEDAKKDHPFYFLARPSQMAGEPWNGELYTAEHDRAKVMAMLQRPEVRPYIPADMVFAWSAKPVTMSDGTQHYSLFALKKDAELNGGVIVDALATIDPMTSTPMVTMEMDGEGSRDWARITGANIGKRIAILMDGSVFSAPVVRSKIAGGNSQIEGMESIEEANLLEIVLKAGALPAPVEIIQQTSVGPSLGDDSIADGIRASIAAFLVTVLFMLVYYRTGGVLADAALLLNLLFTLAVLAAFKGTLTLPGIAGIILTMAIAVDANVLIYERIREEMESGKTFSAVVDTGYAKAFTAIADSNVTTFITAVILYRFGTGPVQGFALTLMIGIAASMFSAIFITRVIAQLLISRGSRLNFG